MITNPAEEYFGQGKWGWDGSVWRKLPLLWGYSGLIGEDLSETNLDAGVNVLNGTAVPAGEIWVVTAVSMKYIGAGGTDMHAYTIGTPGTAFLQSIYTIVSDQWYNARVHVILAQGDYIRGTIGGAILGDDFHVWYSGYKMNID